MKTTKNELLKKIGLAGWSITLVAIGWLLATCSKNKNEDTTNQGSNSTNSSKNIDISIDTEDVQVATAIYYGSEQFDKQIKADISANKFREAKIEPKPYGTVEMLDMISPYIEDRLIRSSPKKPEARKQFLGREKFFVMLDSTFFMQLIKTVEPKAKCNGLAALFAIDPESKHQSVILMPYGDQDSTDSDTILKILPVSLGNDGKGYSFKGVERWDASLSESIGTIVGTNLNDTDTHRGRRTTSISAHFKDKIWKIKK